MEPPEALTLDSLTTLVSDVLVLHVTSSRRSPCSRKWLFTSRSRRTNGVLSPTGTTIAAVVVDFSESVLPYMHGLPAFSPLQFSFEPEQPFAAPSPSELLAWVRDWLEAGGGNGLGYVTADAEEDIDGLLETGDLPGTLDQEPPLEEVSTPRPAKTSKPAKATAPGQGRHTPAEKRPTVASIADSLQEMIQANTGLTQQVHDSSSWRERQ